jgi:tRNA (guanine37-N1)-methyltransferase
MKYPFDVFGNILIVKFPKKIPKKEKIKFGKILLEKNPSAGTILEKTGKFSGRLRKMKTRFVLGRKTKEVLYKENGCVFRFNIDKTYFSPRLSNERKEIASLIKKNKEVFVMFAGVGPFSIVIGKNSGARKVYSSEINREANKYGELNIELNKLKKKVVLVPGDIKKIVSKLSRRKSLPFNQGGNNNNLLSIPKKFDVIVMPRPQLKESFLKQAFMLSKKGTRIYYYDFCETEKKEQIIRLIEKEAKKSNKKIKILKIKEAGEIGPYKIRIRIDFIVCN